MMRKLLLVTATLSLMVAEYVYLAGGDVWPASVMGAAACWMGAQVLGR